jgi:hypothetical protein
MGYLFKNYKSYTLRGSTMTQEHPITPPPKLLQQWWDDTHGALYEFEAVTTQAARWGADQELEACCEWLSVPCPIYGRELRNARRPKPPSLKEQALEALDEEHADMRIQNYKLIRSVLESLPD